MDDHSTKRRATMAGHSTKKRKTVAGQASHETSSSSSSRDGWSYDFDVFLSFRGEDTRKNFTDHLYAALQRAGINVFRDDEGLPRGENISRKLLQAIEGSRISIIVFSRDYSASRWCLEELEKIMECKESAGLLVLPVFYHLDPSDVRNQKGSFEEAFTKHEERFMADKEKVLRWRNALKEAANLAGFDCKDRHEAEFIKDIVRVILRHLNSTYLSEATYPVGIHSRVQEVNSLVSVLSNDVRIIGIYATGGMGKTTIAKAVYNHLFHKFDYKCFLADVRESSKQPIDRVHLQEKLLSEILRIEDIKVGNVHQGINVIKERLGNEKVLIVLDDVDNLEQLRALAIIQCDWLNSGSRIIITSRDKHLLRAINADCYPYMVKELNYDESLELFSWHAFGSSHPEENYVELSKDVIDHCQGLPLALEVLGSSLRGSSAPIWDDTLSKLKRIPNHKVHEKLKISYDALEDYTQKAIFLDVACFFIGVDKDYALAILDGCGFFPTSGIDVLINRCLLTINQYNQLTMHDLLQDMGKEIVRKESFYKLKNYSRLCCEEDVLRVLRMQPKGTGEVQGLALKLATPNREQLKTEAFAEMCNLRLLQLNHVHLTGDGGYDRFSKELRWVCWHGFPLHFIPNNFHVENLVAIDMKNSKLREVWKEIKVLGKLKELNLSHSHYLIKTPNLSLAPNLKKLELNDCISLVEVHPSIGDLDRLVILNMRGCKKLKKLPKRICALKTLEILNLSGCSMFEELPKDLGEMESMIELLADETAIREVPASVVHLKNLKNLSLCGWKGLTSSSLASSLLFWVTGRNTQNSIILPRSILGLSSLTRLALTDCNLSDEGIPNDLGSLSTLESLDLSSNNFYSLPASISELPNLRHLLLNYCTRLESLPELPTSLVGLEAWNCISLDRLPNVSRLPEDADILLINCPKLSVIPGWEELKHGSRIYVQGCDRNLASTLNEMVLQNTCYIYLSGNEIPSRFHHQSTGASISLEVPENLQSKDGVLDVCIVYALGTEGPENMLLTHLGDCFALRRDQVYIEIEPSSHVNVKKWGVHLYHRFQKDSRIQSGCGELLLKNSASNVNSMLENTLTHNMELVETGRPHETHLVITNVLAVNETETSFVKVRVS